MEEKLFKTALEFIEKYGIASYNIDVYPGAYCIGPRIKIQGHAFENYKAMMELDVDYCKEDGWYSFIENGIALTLTYD